ncbi:MAG: nucleotidyltransferase family protein [Rufibacter sp.]
MPLTESPPTLLVLAAGMGSRYGGLKQLDTFGPHGETIMDFSVFDAARAGFGKVVFVIQPSMETEFRSRLLPRYQSRIATHYVTQNLDMLPPGFSVPEDRTKPWGTGHAVWRAAAKIQEPFAVINADDFYGAHSFQLMADFLRRQAHDKLYGIVGFQVKNTLSEHGAVSRGLCQVDAHQMLQSVTEYTHIAKTEDGITVQPPNQESFSLQGDELVSMNLMGFSPSIFGHLEHSLSQFLLENLDQPKAEFYLPGVVNQLVQTGQAQVKVLPCTEQWFGVTYPEDKPVVVESLSALVAAGHYPAPLWPASVSQT